MVNFHQKRKLKKFIYTPFVLVPLALIVLFLSSGVWNVYTKEHETRIKRDKQVAELESLKLRAQALTEEIERLKTERGMEEEIRAKFEVAKDGEKAIVVVDPPPEEETQDVQKPPGLFERFLKLF